VRQSRASFVPFIVETGGDINRRAYLFLDTLQGSRATADFQNPLTSVFDYVQVQDRYPVSHTSPAPFE
jgi:hypothetical protein